VQTAVPGLAGPRFGSVPPALKLALALGAGSAPRAGAAPHAGPANEPWLVVSTTAATAISTAVSLRPRVRDSLRYVDGEGVDTATVCQAHLGAGWPVVTCLARPRHRLWFECGGAPFVGIGRCD